MARRVRFWDLAATADAKNDQSSGVKMAREGNLYYVEDLVHGRWTPHERDAIIKQTAILDGRGVEVVIEQEPGASGLSQIAYLVTMLAGYTVSGRRSTGDKITRAGPLASQAEAGNVKLVEGAWNRAWIDQVCLAEGTLIRTARGDIPIETVAVGDLALTRDGWKRVYRAELTNPEAATIIIQAEGRTLVGTPNHPVWVDGQGFVPMGALQPGDRLLCVSHQSSELNGEKRSSIAASPFIATRSRGTILCGTTSPAAGMASRLISIGLSTRKRLARSLTAITSTMTMATRSTIKWGTSSSRATESIPPTITRFAPGRITSARSVVKPSRHGLLKAPSIAHSAAEISLDLTWGRSERKSANIASSPSRRSSPINASAVTIVLPKPIGMRIDHPTASALSAERVFGQGLTEAPAVRTIAVTSLATEIGRRRVYNLAVEDTPEYFANGILVHNCAFPEGSHDDVPDASASAFLVLTEPQIFPESGMIFTRAARGW